jgi:methyl-accepting chemotaxis protein
MSEIALADALQQSAQAFRWRSTTVTAGVIAIIAAAVTPILWLAGQPARVFIYPAISGGFAAVATLLALQRRTETGVMVLCYGITLTAAAFLMFSGAVPLYSVCYLAVVVLMLLASFLMTPARTRRYGITTVFVLLGVAAYELVDPNGGIYGVVSASANVALFVLAWAIASLVSNHYHENAQLLHQRLQDIDAVVVQAQRIAIGDLSGEVNGTNDVSRVIRGMLDGLRAIVTQVQDGVQILGSAAGELAAMATQQQRGATEQASAVTETRTAMESVADSARKIADSSNDVLRNAESTLETHDVVSHRIGALIDHTQRINELLELIKSVSNKSEILALNAALEGVKAGEAGRGFSLVAAQMQRLAESTMLTVKDVKALMSDIDSATNATVLSIEQANKLAADTARTARGISLTTQQQKTAIEQIVMAMKEIGSVTDEVASGSDESIAAVTEIRQLSERLAKSVHRFVL